MEKHPSPTRCAIGADHSSGKWTHSVRRSATGQQVRVSDQDDTPESASAGTTYRPDDQAIQGAHAPQASSQVSIRFPPRLFQPLQRDHVSTGRVGCGELFLGLLTGLAQHINVTCHPRQHVQVLMSLGDESRMECAHRRDVALDGFSSALGLRGHDNQRACRGTRQGPPAATPPARELLSSEGH
jgi:hypothetical protein